MSYGQDLFSLEHKLLLLNPCLLTSQIPKIEDSRSADLADLVQLDLINERRLYRENPLYTYTARNLADCESPCEWARTLNLDDHTLEVLESLLVALLNPIGNGNGVTSLELRVLGSFLVYESLLCYFNQIHFLNLLGATLLKNKTNRKRLLHFGLQMYALFLILQHFPEKIFENRQINDTFTLS